MVKPNSVNDADMLAEHLMAVKEKTDVTDLYVDGGYWSPEVEEEAKKVGFRYTTRI